MLFRAPALAFLTGITVALAQSQPAPQTMLITSVRTGDTEVFAVDPILGDARNLSRSPQSEDRYASWSYDGRQIVFTSNRTGGGEAFNVFRMDADGRNVRQLTQETGVCYYPNFTADGKTVVFSYADDKAGVAQLISIGVDGQNRRVIADGRDGHVSPDGKRVVFTKRAEKGFPLYVINTDGTGLKQLNADHANSFGAVGPVWSPDGREILYVDQVGQTLEIFTCHADGTGNRQLTRLGQIATSPAWSPDGRRISFRLTNEAYWREERAKAKAYSEKQADKRPVYVMNLTGDEPPEPVQPLRYQCAIDGSRANWRPK